MYGLERAIRTTSVLLASLLLLAMMLQVVIDVAMRSFIGAGFPATADIVSRYYMVAISLFPLAMTQIDLRHIEVTILTDRLGPRAKRANTIFSLGVALACFALLTWFTGLEAFHQAERGAYVEAGILILPTWPSYFIPPISALLMVIVLIIQLLRALTTRPADIAPEQEAQ